MNLFVCCEEVKYSLRSHKFLILVSFLIFIAGIICGIVIEKPLSLDIYFRDYCGDFIFKIVNKDQSVFSLFFARLINHILMFGACLFLAISVWCIPVPVIIIFYKGFIFGTVCVIMVTVYSFSGIFIFIVVYVPQQLLFTTVLIFCVCPALDNALNNKRDRCISLRGFFDIALFALIAVVLIAALELVEILLILRTLNFIL